MSAPSDPRTPQVIELFGALDRVVRSIRLYEGRGPMVESVLDEAEQRFSELLRSGPLTVRLTPFGLTLDGVEVTHGDTPLAERVFRLFGDGVRELRFQPGLTREELEDVVSVLMAEPALGEEDFATLLWHKHLPHVTHLATDTLAASELIGLDSPSLLPGEAVPLGDHGDAPDLRAFREDPSLAWVGECAGPIGTAGVKAGTFDKIRLSFHRAEDDDRFLRLAARAAADVGAPGRLVLELFDNYVDTEQVDRIRSLLDSAARTAAVGGEGAEALREALFEARRLQRLAGLFERRPTVLGPPLCAAVRDYPEALTVLLAELHEGAAQDLLFEALTEAGADLTAFYEQRIDVGSTTTVMLAVENLGRIGSNEAIESVLEALTDPRIRVRRRALEILVGQAPPEARVTVGRMLDDPDRGNRLAALKVLVASGDKRVLAQILARMRDPGFHKHDEDEQAAFFESLAAFNDPRTVAFYDEVLKELSLTNRHAAAQRFLMAVKALRMIGGPQAAEVLLGAARRWSLPREVRAAAKTALGAVQRRRA